MNMEHRQVWKNSLYEPSARVPLIISGPGVAKGKVVSDTLVSLLDIYPVRAHVVFSATQCPLWSYSFSRVDEAGRRLLTDAGGHGWRHATLLPGRPLAHAAPRPGAPTLGGDSRRAGGGQGQGTAGLHHGSVPQQHGQYWELHDSAGRLCAYSPCLPHLLSGWLVVSNRRLPLTAGMELLQGSTSCSARRSRPSRDTSRSSSTSENPHPLTIIRWRTLFPSAH